MASLCRSMSPGNNRSSPAGMTRSAPAGQVAASPSARIRVSSINSQPPSMRRSGRTSVASRINVCIAPPLTRLETEAGVGDAGYGFAVVRDGDDGHALSLGLGDTFDNDAFRGRVQAGSRLIQQQE